MCDGCEARITKDELMKEVVLAGGRGPEGPFNSTPCVSSCGTTKGTRPRPRS